MDASLSHPDIWCEPHSTATGKQYRQGSLQALAAVLGGAHSIAACSFDEALALPTEKSVRLSLRTQQILAYEAGITDTVDPLAGSYYMKSLTNKMEQLIKDLIAQIDDLGGAIAAVEEGFIQKEIEERALTIKKETEAQERAIVGLNKYVVKEELDISLFRSSPEHAGVQIEKFRKLKNTRDQTKVDASLGALRIAAKGDKYFP